MSTRGPARKRVDHTGRAFAGSQRQIQIYVNERRAVLDDALRTACRIATGTIEWVSPLESKAYKEYRDGAFLRHLDLAHLDSKLREFWPVRGPRWDALAMVDVQMKRSVLLIEAKSYPREVRGGGCKAGNKNDARTKIEAALKGVASEIGAREDNWLGDLYQYANRIAHVVFLRRHNVDAHMINVCFCDDHHPSRKTTKEEWVMAASAIKKEAGLADADAPWLVDVFLPAVTTRAAQ